MKHAKTRIHFEDLFQDLNNVDIHIYVEDLSEADAPAKILLEKHLEGVSIRQGEAVFYTDVVYPDVSLDVTLFMRVHVDTTGSGTMSEGDYLTTSAYQLTQKCASTQEDIHVSRI